MRNEIHTGLETSLPEVPNNREISESDLSSFKESNEFWNKLNESFVFEDLSNCSEEKLLQKEFLKNDVFQVGDKIYYTDDHGKIYRVNDNLKSNNEYDINGYHYKTDNQSRIISAEGKLHIKNRDERLPIKDSMETIGKGDQQSGDDRGHLIGDQFDGSNGLENMIPQNSDINRVDFKNFENELAKEVKIGNDVYYSIEPLYDEDSKRPNALIVSYSINGVEGIKVFPNNPKE